MRLLKPVLILCLIPVFSFAQRGGHAGGGAARGSAGGGAIRSGGIGRGSIGSPSHGIGIPGATRGPAVSAGGVYRGPGLSNGGGIGVNRGYLGTYGYNRGLGYRPIYGFGYAYPFYGFGLGFGLPYWGAGLGWPAYYNDTYYPSSYYGPAPGDGLGYDSGYPGGYPGAYPDVDPGYMPGQQPMADIPQSYTPNPPSTDSADTYYRRPDYFLIAFTDHTIQAAVSYRIEGDEIVWTTREQVEKRAPLASVDRRFSEQINRDRRVQFQLP